MKTLELEHLSDYLKAGGFSHTIKFVANPLSTMTKTLQVINQSNTRVSEFQVASDAVFSYANQQIVVHSSVKSSRVSAVLFTQNEVLDLQPKLPVEIDEVCSLSDKMLIFWNNATSSVYGYSHSRKQTSFLAKSDAPPKASFGCLQIGELLCTSSGIFPAKVVLAASGIASVEQLQRRFSQLYKMLTQHSRDVDLHLTDTIPPASFDESGRYLFLAPEQVYLDPSDEDTTRSTGLLLDFRKLSELPGEILNSVSEIRVDLPTSQSDLQQERKTLGNQSLYALREAFLLQSQFKDTHAYSFVDQLNTANFKPKTVECHQILKIIQKSSTEIYILEKCKDNTTRMHQLTGLTRSALTDDIQPKLTVNLTYSQNNVAVSRSHLRHHVELSDNDLTTLQYTGSKTSATFPKVNLIKKPVHATTQCSVDLPPCVDSWELRVFKIEEEELYAKKDEFNVEELQDLDLGALCTAENIVLQQSLRAGRTATSVLTR